MKEPKQKIFEEPFVDYPYVQLSDNEIQEVRDFAAKMNKRKTANKDTFRCDHNNTLGFAGEVAFAKYYELNNTLELFEGGDLYDFEVFSLMDGDTGTIDVKTIDFNGGDLLIQAAKELTADAYCLVERRGDYYGIIGFASRSEVAKATIHPSGEYSPVKVRRIPRDELMYPPESDTLSNSRHQ